MRRSPLMLPVLMAWLGIATQAPAASHHEITIVPIGSVTVKRGPRDVSYRLPSGPEGVLPQALVIMSIRPWHSSPSPASGPTSQPMVEEEHKVRVPATVRFTVAGRPLPAWHLQDYFTAYVINLDTIRANSAYASGRLSMHTDVETEAEGVSITLMGMPDPLLLDSSTDGPLADLAEAAADPDVKAYIWALAMEIADRKEAARREYEKLRTCKNQRVARLARRGLRMLSYNLRKHKISGNFMEHYRWGLYLQQCGLFSAAFNEFEECRILDPMHIDSQYRAAETLDHIGGHIDDVLLYLDRACEAQAVSDPVVWSVLVVILKSRTGSVTENGESVQKVETLSPEQIVAIKNNWLGVEIAVWAASNGVLKIDTSFLEVDDEKQQAYTLHEGWLPGPADDIVEERGWFDGVISVRPRLPGEDRHQVLFGGGDVGPNGAALSALFADAGWQDYLKAWYAMVDWAATVGEVGTGHPDVEDVVGCGHQPIPHDGYACRAAMRYTFTEAMFRRLKIADVGTPGTYVRLWKIEGPYPVQELPPSSGLPSRHLHDPIPAGPPAKTVKLVSDTDFIDLTHLFPDAGWARAAATCWVYSPEDQEVRMWLGQNDGMAVWLNGRCIHEGGYYSAGKYEDKNLVDVVASHAPLAKGWNELRVIVESWPAPRNKGWGFSVRFCEVDNETVPGIAYVYERPRRNLAPRYTPPAIGDYYSWEKVKSDYHNDLPRLSAADLQQITGAEGLTVAGRIEKTHGYVIITAPKPAPSPSYRRLATPWQAGRDRDVVLNNVLDWAREDCAVLRYRKGDKNHDLLLVKSEAVDAYLTLLDESPEAAEVFGKTAPADRLFGYVVIPAGSSTRNLIAVDTLLGDDDGRWPVDEEDLLAPPGRRQ